jgi:hypothetical protein
VEKVAIKNNKKKIVGWPQGYEANQSLKYLQQNGTVLNIGTVRRYHHDKPT